MRRASASDSSAVRVLLCVLRCFPPPGSAPVGCRIHRGKEEKEGGGREARSDSSSKAKKAKQHVQRRDCSTRLSCL